jgi:uncharacterized membrane protein YebE (DUF533 family)
VLSQKKEKTVKKQKKNIINLIARGFIAVMLVALKKKKKIESKCMAIAQVTNHN